MPDTVTVPDGTHQNRSEMIIHRSGDGYERVASADVLLYILRIPAAQQNSAHGQRLSRVMAHVGWKRNPSGLVTINGKSVRGYLRPDLRQACSPKQEGGLPAVVAPPGGVSPAQVAEMLGIPQAVIDQAMPILNESGRWIAISRARPVSLPTGPTDWVRR
jgi:hypothetical protein